MSTPRKLPGSLNTNRSLDRWLAVNADGTVTVRPGKVEIGQGILTALAQIVAEELDVGVGRIRLVPAGTDTSPDEGVTSGSRSIVESGMALRSAAAEARDLLLERAAARLGVSLEQLTVHDGVVRARSGGSVTYWDLADAELLKREASGDAIAKSAAEHGVVGTSLHRLDIPKKIVGAPSYVQDLDLPGMLHGRIARPPAYAATLESVDAAGVKAMPGVVAVVRDGSFLGVVAEREEQAIRAQRRLARTARWKTAAVLPESDPRYLLAQSSEDEVISEKQDAAAAAGAARRLNGEYARSFVAHASLAPSCAIACFDAGRYAVWTHSQGIFPLRRDLARILRVDESALSVVHAEGAGCYGHNGADDVAVDAALLARAVPGRPVRVQWMREDEFGWEPYGSAMVVKTGAAIDAGGRIVDWNLELWSHGHTSRPGVKEGPNLIGGWHIADGFPRLPANNPPITGGGGSHRNAVPYYDFPNQKVVNHLVRESAVRVSSLRSLGAHVNVFAIESFMDELAEAAGADPVEFRLRHLKDPRARAVIEKAADMAGWRAREKGDGTRGRGVAFARYKNVGCYVGLVLEVVVAETVRVSRVWAATDVGQAINPDGVINQTEGGIVQTISWTLKERVQHDRERILTATWDDYAILTFAEVPQIEAALINRPADPALGAGEGTQGPTAGAIGNAIYNALGLRLREMPFTRERLIAAMA